MNDNLVEKVARVICQATPYGGPALCDTEYAAMATAAIAVIREALQEPSGEMVEAAAEAGTSYDPDDPCEIWKAMLEASPISDKK